MEVFMSHDFYIERKKDKKKAVFNGYAEGVFYKHFHCEKLSLKYLKLYFVLVFVTESQPIIWQIQRMI